MRNISKWSVGTTLAGSAVVAYLGATAITWLGYLAENPAFCRPPVCALPRFEFESALFAISFVLGFVVTLGVLLTRTIRPAHPSRSTEAAHGYVVAALVILVLSRLLSTADLYSLELFPTQWWMTIAAIGLVAGAVVRNRPGAMLVALAMTGFVGVVSLLPGFGGLGAAWAAVATLARDRDSAIVAGAMATFGWAVFTIGPAFEIEIMGLSAAAAILLASLAEPLVLRARRVEAEAL
ncbi:MAG: hypothetical protein HKO76_11505 [Acidimicrobiia bacterium]|nr:hypothetical protein [Acidimicrobiia bacterium]